MKNIFQFAKEIFSEWSRDKALNLGAARKALEIMNRVLEFETSLYGDHPEKLVQGHVDFHRKNIFIGQDSDAPSSRFVAAIDFGNSYTMPPAFDVGTFLAQFRNQFYDRQKVLDKVSENIFLQKYLKEANQLDEGFLRQVEVFRARGAISIPYSRDKKLTRTHSPGVSSNSVFRWIMNSLPSSCKSATDLQI